jgi:ribosomal protein S18 acetylase RimI-like enzyme
MATTRTTPDGLAVHAATPDDVDALVELMTVFYAESGFPLDRGWAAASMQHLIAHPDQGRIWLARERSGAAAGHAVLTTRYTMEFGALGGYVDDLFVRPASRRQGVGRALLDALFDECRARGCRSVQVEVAPDNVPARALYAALGLAPHADPRLLLSAVLE